MLRRNTGRFFLAPNRAVGPKPTGEGNCCILRHLPAKTLQKTLYVGFSMSRRPLQVVWFGWPQFPFLKAPLAVQAGPICRLTPLLLPVLTSTAGAEFQRTSASSQPTPVTTAATTAVLRLRITHKVSHRSQPPLTIDLPPSRPAGSGWLNRLVELSRYAAGKPSRLVDNPALEVDSRRMQHSTVLCFRFQLERRLKLWQTQGGCDKSKRHIFTGGVRGRFSIIGLLGPFFALF